MRILIADKMAPQVVPSLEANGCTVALDPGLSGDALERSIAQSDPQILVVRSTKVAANHLSAARSLSLIIRAGAGVNTIDVDRASEKGIYVANCPGKNAAAVAELALGHILNADRRIADNVIALREGQWSKKQFAKGCRGLKGRTLGLVGMGNIGAEVAKRAQAFEMKVVAWDIQLTPERAAQLGVQQADGPVEVAQQADVLSVHIALNDQTRGLVSDHVLSALKPGAIFINTSRGPVVDEQALQKVVQERNIKCGLDVFCDEPNSDGDWSNALALLPSVYGTHHIGASTEEASESVGDEVIRIVRSWTDEGLVPNCVNLAQASLASHLLVVRHKDKVGVLAGVLDCLKQGNINVQEMQNIVFQGGAAACAHIQVSHAPSSPLIEQLQRQQFVLAVDVVELERT